MDYQYLSAMKLSSAIFKIKIRLLRLWESSNPNFDNQLFSLDFVVVDEQGSSMQGMIKSMDIPYFSHHLEEGRIYDVSNFVVCPSKGKFRAVPHDLMLRFTRSTSITEQPDTVCVIPRYKFHFVNFHDMSTRIHNDKILTDVVGHILSVSRIGNTYVRDAVAQKKNLDIEDLSGTKLLVTLWGKVAESFPENIILSKDRPVIIVLAGMTVRPYQGRPCICSCSATKFYIDIDIPEVRAIREKLNPNDLTCLMPSESFSTLSPAQELLDNKKNILELQFLDPKLFQNIRFTCTATIIEIDVSERWWYDACKTCRTAVQPIETTFWCDQCVEVEETPVPWYKLNVIGKDESGRASFIMFETVVANLIGLPCSVLVSNHGKDNTDLPPIFNSLVGQTYNFRVVLVKQNMKKMFQLKVAKIIPGYAFDSVLAPTGSCYDKRSSGASSSISKKFNDVSKSPPPPESAIMDVDEVFKRKEVDDNIEEVQPRKKSKNV